MESNKVNWLDLPDDVASIIVTKLNFIKDYIRFGAVCHLWRDLYKQNQLNLPRQPLTLLMVTKFHCDESKTRFLYSITDKRDLRLEANFQNGVVICGSSHGWLVTGRPCTYGTFLCLVNPLFLGEKVIELPPLLTRNINKVVLSSNPRSKSFSLAFAIHDSYKMAICEVKENMDDNSWIPLPCLCDSVADVVYYMGKFCVVDYEGKVFAFDLRGLEPQVWILTETPIPRFDSKRRLSELSGDLFQICSVAKSDDGYGEFRNYSTDGFFCFKLDMALNWIETDNLSGHTLFLGDNHALSVLSSDFPECKPNAIYYIDDYAQGSSTERYRYGLAVRHVAVFSLSDSSVETILSNMMMASPIWIEPTLGISKKS